MHIGLEQALCQMGKQDRYIFYAHVLDERDVPELAAELGFDLQGRDRRHYRSALQGPEKRRGDKYEFKGTAAQGTGRGSAGAGKLLLLYQPLLMTESVVNGLFDEDVYPGTVRYALTCIRRFQI